MMETLSPPLFSILMANYNNAKYIRQAINSVLQQTYKQWELIIVDDCSTDNSWEIFMQYTIHPNIILTRNEQNKGCGYTKRRCVSLAHGSLCGFLDTDDALLTNALETMVQAHNKNPQCSLICSRSYLCNSKLIPYSVSERTQLLQSSSYLQHTCHAPNHFASFKKSSYDKTNGIAAEVTHAVDQDMYFKLEEIGPFLFLDTILYKYRTHKKSISHNPQSFGKAMAWHAILIHQAYKRRGFSGEEQQIAKLLTRPYYTWKYRFGNLMLSPAETIIQWIQLLKFNFFRNNK